MIRPELDFFLLGGGGGFFETRNINHKYICKDVQDIDIMSVMYNLFHIKYDGF